MTDHPTQLQSGLLFCFAVPHVPIPKARARSRIVKTTAGKQFTSHYTPKTTRNFEDLVKQCASQAIGGHPPLTCPVDLLVEFQFAVPPSWPKWKRELAKAGLVHHTKKPDCSNLVKAIEDACNGVLFKDDGQVVGSIQDKVWTASTDRVVVRVYRRAGISCQATRAEAEGLDTRVATIGIGYLPLGQRIRALQLVGK